MEKIIGVKELRENLDSYAKKVNKGESFVVVRRSKPLFKITPITEDNDGCWERVADFTKINKDGVDAREILKYL